jgi:hypothetical protein
MIAIQIAAYSLLLITMILKAKKMPKKFGALTSLSLVIESLERYRIRISMICRLAIGIFQTHTLSMSRLSSPRVVFNLLV